MLTPKWMFVATLTQPYTHNKGMPVYLDGYAYAGIFNVQLVQKEWPATAGLIDDEKPLFDLLEVSSKLPPVEIEDLPSQE